MKFFCLAHSQYHVCVYLDLHIRLARHDDMSVMCKAKKKL